ncbi:MAG: SNF2-related protein [Caldilineaceae bacterium]
MLGEDISTLQRLTPSSAAGDSPWSRFDQVIVSLDSVKPLDKRRGWTAELVAAYNQSRFEDLVTAGWDLVIVDEAHRLGGSTDQVARYRLGQGLAEAAPYFLLLSATPHQGKTDAFHRLVSLLDPDAFPDVETVTRDRVAPFVIRTEKRKAVDGAGKPLFKPRRTQLAPVQWTTRHRLQALLYEAVTDYVRDGYNQALHEKQRHIGFLMILMQRLVVSSTRAIRTTLERRLAAIQGVNHESVPPLRCVQTIQMPTTVTTNSMIWMVRNCSTVSLRLSLWRSSVKASTLKRCWRRRAAAKRQARMPKRKRCSTGFTSSKPTSMKPI